MRVTECRTRALRHIAQTMRRYAAARRKFEGRNSAASADVALGAMLGARSCAFLCGVITEDDRARLDARIDRLMDARISRIARGAPRLVRSA